MNRYVHHIYNRDFVFRRLVFSENRFSSQKIFANLKRPDPSPEVGRADFRPLDVAGRPGLRRPRLLLGVSVRVSAGSQNAPARCEAARMNGKSASGSPGGMAGIEGLPPLPKSLSGLLNSSGGSWREMERMYVKKTMIQDDLSRGRNPDGLLAHKPANLDAALALLRKEMVKIPKLLTLVANKGVVFLCPPGLFNP